MIYLDNAATTKINPIAQEARNKSENETYANSSSMHSFAMESARLIKESKEILAGVLNCSPSEIYFTKGATESNNIAIHSFESKDKIALTSKIEHSSVYETLKASGFKEVIYLDNDQSGFIDLDDMADKITDDVSFVSIIYVNNEIGTIQDITAISKIIRYKNPNIVIHIDATQALGKISCDVEALDVDMMSFSAHKIYGPKGIGGMFVRKDIIDKIRPIMLGGNQQVISSGTDSHPAIYGFAIALRELVASEEYSYIRELNTYMRDLIAANISEYSFNTPDENSSPYILSVGFKGIKSEVLLHMLEQNEIYVSSGSACSKGVNNRVLTALGVDSAYMDGVIRFSFSSELSKEDLDYTVKVLADSIGTIRKVMG